MSTARLRLAQTEELGADRLDELTRLCEAAFEEPFAAVWERIGPGLHVMAEAEGRIVAHAMVIDRRIYLGHEMDVALDAGYVENVATLPEAQGAGHAASVMREIGRIIGDEYDLGALATGSNAFYEKLGWETWTGPTGLRMADGERLRSADEDGHVMVLRTSRSPSDLDLDAPIAVDWRAGDPW
ncbi:MAG: GNAT family N-acetyltransferase [Chloroflexota bacterium]|nr:GNAT family N-acetyltransferase [Chloroflexota bacterium]